MADASSVVSLFTVINEKLFKSKSAIMIAGTIALVPGSPEILEAAVLRLGEMRQLY